MNAETQKEALNALQRDLDFAAHVEALLSTMKLTGTVQYDVARSRIKELSALIAKIKIATCGAK
jgi:hypothetical protein